MSDWYTPGWIDDPAAVDEIVSTLTEPDVSYTAIGSIETLPTRVHLWDAARKVLGNLLPPRNQGRVGSCVGFGTARAIEYTMLSEIASGEPEMFEPLAAEVIYAGARVEVGGRRIRGDGAIGAHAATFVRDWGVLAREVYGEHDLSTYSEGRARQWGDNGVPDDIEKLTRSHPVRQVTRVRNWTDAKRALASGYAIAICSGQGFSMRRDSNGIANATGSWAHCMTLCGYDQHGQDEIGRIDNSWGPDAHTGPVGAGNPGPEGFWAFAEVIDSMLARGDAWIFANVDGFVRRSLPWLI